MQSAKFKWETLTNYPVTSVSKRERKRNREKKVRRGSRERIK